MSNEIKGEKCNHNRLTVVEQGKIWLCEDCKSFLRGDEIDHKVGNMIKNIVNGKETLTIDFSKVKSDTNKEMKKDISEKVKGLIDKGYSFLKVKEMLGISSTSMVAFYLKKARGKLKTRAELVEENERLRQELSTREPVFTEEELESLLRYWNVYENEQPVDEQDMKLRDKIDSLYMGLSKLSEKGK